MKLRRVVALPTAAALAFAPVLAGAQTKVSHLPAGSAVAASDLAPMSQSCTGSPPTATCGATNAVTGAQLKAWAQSGLAASATTDTTNASNISSGTLPTARLPADLAYFPLAATVNLNASGDQATITIPPQITKYRVNNAFATNCSTTPTSAAVNIWTGASATGLELGVLTSGQLAGATSPAVIANGTGATTTLASAGTLHVNVATPNGSALTCSIVLQLFDFTGA